MQSERVGKPAPGTSVLPTRLAGNRIYETLHRKNERTGATFFALGVWLREYAFDPMPWRNCDGR
jgi:hypothetical protein